MPHVQQIGAKSHSTGSLQNVYVRQYLVAQLKAIGLKPQMQSVLVVNPQIKHAGKVHNVLVRIPGTKPNKALLLAAHYDSVHTGSGAADDGASVAAILETLRAIKTQPTLQNDLICIFTDGEETGLLGAEAFIQQHPWAKDIGLVLNFEYRGNRGAFMMFETSQGNGKLIEGLAAAIPFLSATSLFYEVYKRLPNDTDLTVFKQAGIPGMNFAAIEGLTSYHTQLDRPELLDQGTLQNEGDIILNLVKHFGNVPLTDLKTKDRVYFDLPGLGLVHYLESWIIPLNILLLFIFSVLITVGSKRKIIRIKHVLLGAIAFISIIALLAVSSHFLWSGIQLLHPGYQTFLQGDTYNSYWYLLAFVFLNIGLFGFLQFYACKWLRLVEFNFAVMAVWLTILIAVGVLFPGVSFLFFWPLAAVLMVLVMILILRKNPPQSAYTLLIFLGSVPGIIIFTPFIRNLYIGLTPHMIGVVIISLALLLGLINPLLESIGQRPRFICSTLALGIAAFAAGSWTYGFDADHPRQNTLFYVFDNAEQKAFWLSTDKQLDQWTSKYFPNIPAKQSVSTLMGSHYPLMWISPAPHFPMQAPKVETLEDIAITENGAVKRKLKLSVISANQVSKLKLTIDDINVLASSVAGQRFTDTPQSHWQLDSVGLNEQALVIDIIVQAGTPFTLRVLGIAYGLPPGKGYQRPSNFISKPSEFSDTRSTITVVRYNAL